MATEILESPSPQASKALNDRAICRPRLFSGLATFSKAFKKARAFRQNLLDPRRELLASHLGQEL